ncbi:helix-turn-helix transcriptional regulator [Propioniciclava sp.]|uniref:helix-turn-helix domain-containing protein n=1 Tax=Propioniciclava sp. TaxID=2038686 RepID=UPI0026097116|nr:helix-turn-helix transcriptional regulator [Propioniciclava sp.]
MMIVVTLDVALARAKMTVTELADRVGITQANLSNLKNGRARGVRFSTLDAICRELGCQPADLLAHAPDADGRHSTSQPRSRSAAP